MKLKFNLCLGDTLRTIRPLLTSDAWLTVYRAMEAYCARYQSSFNPIKWRAHIDRECSTP